MLKHMSYELNDRILCKYGDLYYEGKIVNISTNADGRVFRVHYQGWHKRHDVDIPEQQSKQLFLPYTAENLARTKTELENARLERKRKSTCKNASAANANTSTNASSASPVVTPRRGKTTSTTSHHRDPSAIKFYYGCLPQSLRDILEKDRDAVIHRRLLAKLPAMYTIDVIIYEFLNSLRIDVTKKGDKLIVFFDDDVSSSRISDLIRSCQMITDYFNLMLGKMLLYPPERDQYQSELLRLRLSNLNDAEDSKERPHLGSTQLPDNSIPVRHTSVYGLPHLLRFFNSLTEKSEGMSVDSGPLLALKVITSELVDFLNENREKYFSVRRDYEPQE